MYLSIINVLKDGVIMDRLDILNKLQELRKKGVFTPTDEMIKSLEEIEGIRQASIVNTKVLDAVADMICEGVSTYEIDKVVYDTTIALGGKPATLGYEGFPSSCCTSINDQVCHGIPSKEDILKVGDIVNVDCVTEYNGYYGDSSRMFIIGETSFKNQRLVRVAKECLDKAFESIKPWESTLGDIGYIISKHAKNNGFSIVLEVGGHGVGLKMHEEPFVCHVGKKGTDMLIVPGMVFTIEPMVNAGRRNVFLDASNDWTIYTEDGSNSAQWEYTIAVFEDHAEILSK